MKSKKKFVVTRSITVQVEVPEKADEAEIHDRAGKVIADYVTDDAWDNEVHEILEFDEIKFDYDKEVRTGSTIIARKPAFYFSVHVVLPLELISYWRTKTNSEVELEEKLEQIAEDWARRKIRLEFEQQRIFDSSFARASAKRTSYPNSWEVLVAYSWG